MFTQRDMMLPRRQWLGTTAALALGTSLRCWMPAVAAAVEGSPRPKRSCILLWMNGGPSQTDTFDLKPEHANGGPFQPIETRTLGIQYSEHLPETAKWSDHLAVVRSMSTKEGDHGRARDNLRTGYFPQASIQFPVLGSLVAKEAGEQTGELPNYVSIFSRGLFSPGMPPSGFLGPSYAPLVVGRESGDQMGGPPLAVENLAAARGISPEQVEERLRLLTALEQPFLTARPGASAESHREAYRKANRLMSPSAAKAFSLDDEPADVRDRYGRGQFGQGCLLARRLVERNVPFVEVSLGGWDTHEANFPRVQSLCGTLDTAWAALMQDLSERGLLETTLVVWMGEFGRTPVINPRQGRDHYPKAWSVVLGGGGIRGGQVVGRTDASGLVVDDRPVSTPDLLATIFVALGIDPRKQNMSNVARPIRLADPDAKPIAEILTESPV